MSIKSQKWMNVVVKETNRDHFDPELVLRFIETKTSVEDLTYLLAEACHAYARLQSNIKDLESSLLRVVGQI
jgi:hypothetical protein